MQGSASRRNVVAYLMPEMAWGFASALTFESAMPAAFANAFDGAPSFVGSISLCAAFGLAAAGLATGWFVAPRARRMGVVLWGHVLTGLAYGAVALLVRVAAPSGDAAVRLAYVSGALLFFGSLGFVVPAWLGLLGHLFPEASRGRLLGTIFILHRCGGWLGGLVAQRVLAAPWDPVDQWSLMFALAMTAATLSSFSFLLVREPSRTPEPRHGPREYVRSLARSFRELPGLRRFVLADALGLTAMVMVVHYGDAAINFHGIDPVWAGRWIAVASVAQLATACAVAILGSRLAPRRGIALGLALVTFAAPLAAVARAPQTFAVVAAAGGCFLTLRMTCHAPMVLRLARGRDGTAPLGLATALTQPVTGIAPFVAGVLVPFAGHAAVFACVAACTLVATLLLLLYVPDEGGYRVSSVAASEAGTP
jgi:hypothetical protein